LDGDSIIARHHCYQRRHSSSPHKCHILANNRSRCRLCRSPASASSHLLASESHLRPGIRGHQHLHQLRAAFSSIMVLPR
jgi:hypothetical protein